jgi:hypothetical protein
MAGDVRTDGPGGVPALEARLASDEARLAADEARLEAEDREVRENRVVAWSGVAIALALAIAVTALVLAVVALRHDVGTLQQDTPASSVGTSSLRDDSVTADKLAPRAVGRDALAAQAVGAEQLAAGSVTGPAVADAGTRVLSGGARIRGAVSGAALVSNAPDAGTGWTATARVAATPPRTWQLVVSAVCAAGGA